MSDAKVHVHFPPRKADIEGLRAELREIVANDPIDRLEDGCHYRHVLAAELLTKYLGEPTT